MRGSVPVSSRLPYGEQLEIEVEDLRRQLADARRTAEYWKAEHLAGNKQLADIIQTSFDLCPECGWRTLIPGEGCLKCAKDGTK